MAGIFYFMNIAIQGYPGSFHHEAVQKYFGTGAKILPCASFRELIKAAADSRLTDGGLMAIENSIAGSILPNYSLLHNSDLHIVGEVYLLIKQQLMVRKGVQLKDITEVHAHNMALLQCGTFLDQYPWKLVETEDTALSAKNIATQEMRHTAAIASKAAARLYDLDIIAPDIQDLHNNYTRFLVLSRDVAEQSTGDADKGSLSFSVAHETGSLSKVLQIISLEGLNMSKLQSIPVPGDAFRYQFIADLEFDHVDQLYTMIKKIKTYTNTCKLHGIYKKAIWKQQTD